MYLGSSGSWCAVFHTTSMKRAPTPPSSTSQCSAWSVTWPSASLSKPRLPSPSEGLSMSSWLCGALPYCLLHRCSSWWVWSTRMRRYLIQAPGSASTHALPLTLGCCTPPSGCRQPTSSAPCFACSSCTDPLAGSCGRVVMSFMGRMQQPDRRLIGRLSRFWVSWSLEVLRLECTTRLKGLQRKMGHFALND